MNGKKLVRGTILTALCMTAMLYANGMVSRAFWVEVRSDETRVRDAASTDSDVMTAVNAGDKLNVVSEEKDSAGNTWYKVSINNVSGYVRSDTVQETSEPGLEQSQSVAASEQPAATAEQPVQASSSSTVEPMATQAATVKKDDVNVRASASTGGNVVAKLQNGAAVTLTGTASDSSGKTWYQVNFINNGSNVTGFIREDFVEPGEVMEPQAPVEETPEEDADLAGMYGDMPTESGAANNDYELFYEPDTEGVDCWYIHDNIAQKRYKLEQLMNADEMNANNMAIKDKEIKRLKIILIVLAVLLAVALVAAGIFGYKYLGAGSDDDEEDEDDDFRTAAPVRRRERTPAEAGSRRREADREEERSPRGTARRTDAGVQRRPASGQRRPEGENVRPRSAQPARTKEEAEARRRPSAGTARPGSAQPADAARVRRAQPADGDRVRRTQSAPQSRRPQDYAENEAVRKSSRTDVEWRSKNFLAGDEDGLDFSFINGNDETFPE